MTRRRLLPFTCGVLAAAIGVVVSGPSPVAAADPPDTLIDSFQAGPTALSQACPLATPTTMSFPGAGSIGGEVDLSLMCDPSGTGFGPISGTIGHGSLGVETFASAAAGMTVTWDGPDAAPALDHTGLGGIDLTGGATKDSPVMDVTTGAVNGGGALSAAFEILVYTDDAHVSRLFTLLPALPTAAITMPFAAVQRVRRNPGR